MKASEIKLTTQALNSLTSVNNIWGEYSWTVIRKIYIRDPHLLYCDDCQSGWIVAGNFSVWVKLAPKQPLDLNVTFDSIDRAVLWRCLSVKFVPKTHFTFTVSIFEQWESNPCLYQCLSQEVVFVRPINFQFSYRDGYEVSAVLTRG